MENTTTHHNSTITWNDDVTTSDDVTTQAQNLTSGLGFMEQVAKHWTWKVREGNVIDKTRKSCLSI